MSIGRIVLGILSLGCAAGGIVLDNVEAAKQKEERDELVKKEARETCMKFLTTSKKEGES